MLNANLASDLKRLRLPAMARQPGPCAPARPKQEGKRGYLEFTARLVQDEPASRESTSFQKRLKLAGINSRMTFEFFDFNFNAAVLAPQARPRPGDLPVHREEHRTRVLAGPPGIGKSPIAPALGHEAARRGPGCRRLLKTHKLRKRLAPDRLSAKRPQLLLKRCLAAGLLILDDFAFRPYSQQETELLYTLCDERLSAGSIIVTSNRPPEDWFAVFPDPIVGGAIMDRLVSGAVKLIVPSGRSYRKEGRCRIGRSTDFRLTYSGRSL